ncbi:MAG: DUF3536 domain-containing protein [bacterium]
MSRYITIHGHFYQPPRENPWLEEIELQDSAHPHHDWNDRISQECYGPNAASRILDEERRIIDIVNNYEKISFNFGPTLLSWIEKKEPELYRAILSADKNSQNRFLGHGSAISQAYSHMIMPLSNARDKRTQVIWGIYDFIHRFKREPEGMWLPETAVDIETLELLAENKIKFTILSPGQAKKVRYIGDNDWIDVSGQKIDPKMPYLCNLPSGRTMTIFFYDGPISHEISFGKTLISGEGFAKRLENAFVPGDHPQLVHVATDGETFGHHHRFGDMALAYCTYFIEKQEIAQITIYAEYLDKNKLTHEVQIIENSAWSCAHGLGRWQSDCGCSSGANPGWKQQWRAPLRSAMDWLRDNLIGLYESQMFNFFEDPWKVRDDYISVILDRTTSNVDKFLNDHAGRELSLEEKVKCLKLLEMQRHAMLMYTSCGWFFDDISGIETIQIMSYAARAMQLAYQVQGLNLEDEYLKMIVQATGNVRGLDNGKVVYERYIKDEVLDLLRVGAHYAVSSLFKDYAKTASLYSYTAVKKNYDRLESGKQKLAYGRVVLSSRITHETAEINFAVLHLGDHNLISGVCDASGEMDMKLISKKMKEAFQKGDTSEVMALIGENFGSSHYSLWHLFRDEQREILRQIVDLNLVDIETTFQQVYEQNYPIMQALNEMRIPLPRAFSMSVEFVLNSEIKKILDEGEIDIKALKRLAGDIDKWNIGIDKSTVGYVASQKLLSLVKKLMIEPRDMKLLNGIDEFLIALNEMGVPLNIWKAQNIYFNISRKIFKDTALRAEGGDEGAREWVDKFNNVGEQLRIKNG